jgi:hypothetical protein
MPDGQQHLPALGPVVVAVALSELVRTRRILWNSSTGAPHYHLPAQMQSLSSASGIITYHYCVRNSVAAAMNFSSVV